MSNLLAVRALNLLRKVDLTSYVALRAALVHSPDSGYVDNLAQHLAGNQRGPRLRHSSIVKRFTPGGTIEYRDMSVPSPTAALVEAWVLRELSKVYEPHPRVFSYRWPSPGAGYNFEYYWTGYMERATSISTWLQSDARQGVFITDLRGFYPAITREDLLPRVEEVTRKITEPLVRDSVLSLAQHFCALGRGLPIGPDFSHWLAQVALENVDAHLGQIFGKRYFRYVDDIAIIAPLSEMSSVRREVKSVVEGSGFELNGEKTEECSAVIWLEYFADLGGGTFFDFASLLTAFLGGQSRGELESIRATLDAHGFSLPVMRYFHNSRYSRMAYWLKRWWRRSSLQDILERAQREREESLRRLVRFCRAGIPATGAARRWAIQRISRETNILLYLMPAASHGMLRAILPDVPELSIYQLLMEAFESNDVTSIMRLPGGISRFCAGQLWERGSSAPKVNWTSRGIHPDSVYDFALYGLCAPPPEYWDSQGVNNALTQIYSGNGWEWDGTGDLSWFTEVGSLLGHLPQSDMLVMATTRAFSSEGLHLDALSIGGSQYS